MTLSHVQSRGLIAAPTASDLPPPPSQAADRFVTAPLPARPAAPLPGAPSLAEPGPATAPRAIPTIPSDSITVDGVTVTLEQAARVAPILFLHPAEPYLPCSAEYLLDGAVLVTEDGTRIESPSQADLQAHRGGQARLLVNPAHFGGEPLQEQRVTAPMYVSVQVSPDKQTIDLNYLFLYAFNGAQTVRMRVPRSSYNCVLPHIAEHGGDVECITVRVSADFSAIHFVRTEAHGHDAYYTRPAEQMTLDRGHPLIYSAYNSHGSFNLHDTPSDRWITDTHVSALGFGMDFIDIVSHEGPRWQPFEIDAEGNSVPNGQLRFLGVRDGVPVTDQVWAAYAGRIGEHRRNTFEGATAIGGGPLPAPRRRLAEMLTRAVVNTGVVNKRLDTDGIPALGDRPVAQAGISFWTPPAAK